LLIKKKLYSTHVHSHTMKIPLISSLIYAVLFYVEPYWDGILKSHDQQNTTHFFWQPLF